MIEEERHNLKKELIVAIISSIIGFVGEAVRSFWHLDPEINNFIKIVLTICVMLLLFSVYRCYEKTKNYNDKISKLSDLVKDIINSHDTNLINIENLNLEVSFYDDINEVHEMETSNIGNLYLEGCKKLYSSSRDGLNSLTNPFLEILNLFFGKKCKMSIYLLCNDLKITNGDISIPNNLRYHEAFVERSRRHNRDMQTYPLTTDMQVLLLNRNLPYRETSKSEFLVPIQSYTKDGFYNFFGFISIKHNRDKNTQGFVKDSAQIGLAIAEQTSYYIRCLRSCAENMYTEAKEISLLYSDDLIRNNNQLLCKDFDFLSLLKIIYNKEYLEV